MEIENSKFSSKFETKFRTNLKHLYQLKNSKEPTTPHIIYKNVSFYDCIVVLMLQQWRLPLGFDEVKHTVIKYKSKSILKL